MTQKNTGSRKYHGFTERYCYEIGENVVLRSTSPDNESYECVYASFCKARDRCIRCPKKDKEE